jgi:Flp pilus assembly protein TadG
MVFAFCGRRSCARFVRETTGSSATEFAMVLPVMAILLFGTLKFGLALNNHIQLTHAASAAARQLSISRGSPTPYSSTIEAMQAAAPTLKASSITSTLTVGTTNCTADDATCQNAFGNGSSAIQAKAVLRYPCNIALPFVPISNCTLSTSASGLVQ